MTSHDLPAGASAGAHYIPPRHNVLLLSCMDPRLIDDLTNFMHRDNLTNRFDQVILAGASLGVLQTEFPHWRETFFEHLGLAIALHNVKDIYIVEHRNCGAYVHFLGHDYPNTREEQDREEQDHCVCAFKVKHEILSWAVGKLDPFGKPVNLHIYCFLMDLRGSTKLLTEPETPQPAKPKPKPPKKKAPPRG